MDDDDRAKFNDFLIDLETRTNGILFEEEFIQQRRNLEMMRQRQHQQQLQSMYPLGSFGLQHMSQQELLVRNHRDRLMAQTQMSPFVGSSTPNPMLQTLNHRYHSILDRTPQARPITTKNNTNIAQIHHPQPQATLQIQNSIAHRSVTPNLLAPQALAHHIHQRKEFPRILFEVLQGKVTGAFRWTEDGQAFYENYSTKVMKVVVNDFFKLTPEEWRRELNEHGWKKPRKGKYRGFYYHPHFRRDMTEIDFKTILKCKDEHLKEKVARNMEETIRRALANPIQQSIEATNTAARKETNPTQQSIEAKNTAARKETNPFLPDLEARMPAKKPKVATKDKVASKKKMTNAIKTKVSTTKASTKRKVAPGTVSQASSLKKTKRTETPTSPERFKKKQKQTTAKQKEATSSPKPSHQRLLPSKIVDSINDQKEIRTLKRALREHKKLHNMLWKWDLWNFPKHLDETLKLRKRRHDKRRKLYFQNHPSEKPQTNEDPEAHLVKNMSGEISDLLCDEELPECLSNGEQDLAEFVERIRKDKLKQDKLDEIWSNMVIPEVNGKALPASKFAKPNETWKDVKEGDKIEIFCRETDFFNKATVRKKRRSSSYFHLSYDDDGTEEWLDLSREKIKILADIDTITAENATPRKDDRVQSPKNNGGGVGSIHLPESYSHLAPFIRYSWKRLGLGSLAGTPSYNEYVNKRDPSAPKATVLEILNEVRALRSMGFSGISLQVGGENPAEDESGSSSDSEKRCKEQLRTLQDKIEKEKDAVSSMQEFDKTLDSVRKLTDSWSVRMVKENLRTIDTQISKLNEREAIILKKCKEKGLC